MDLMNFHPQIDLDRIWTKQGSFAGKVAAKLVTKGKQLISADFLIFFVFK